MNIPAKDVTEPKKTEEVAKPIEVSSEIDSDAYAIYLMDQDANLNIGRFQFEQGILVLDNAKDEEEFTSLLNHPRADQRIVHRIKKFDAAEIASVIVRKRKAAMSSMGDTASLGIRDVASAFMNSVAN